MELRWKFIAILCWAAVVTFGFLLVMMFSAHFRGTIAAWIGVGGSVVSLIWLIVALLEEQPKKALSACILPLVGCVCGIMIDAMWEVFV